MPVLFIGHGSPMNAIQDNAFSRTWKQLGTELPVPQAILSISAHWLTPGKTRVTLSEKPKTIHDFHGFPQPLFEAQYPAPGAVEQAQATIDLMHPYPVEGDHQWGLDHGTWSVLLPMFPQANIPVYQLSIDYTAAPEQLFALAAQLKALRRRGVLVIGSGNMVHNLRALRFDGGAYDWAAEFDTRVAELINKRDYEAIARFQQWGVLAQAAHPTHDHFLPLLYALALVDERDEPAYFNTSFDMGSVSMRSVLWA